MNKKKRPKRYRLLNNRENFKQWSTLLVPPPYECSRDAWYTIDSSKEISFQAPRPLNFSGILNNIFHTYLPVSSRGACSFIFLSRVLRRRRRGTAHARNQQPHARLKRKGI